MHSLHSSDSRRPSSSNNVPSFMAKKSNAKLPSVALTQAMTHVKDFMTDAQKALVLLREGRTLMDNSDLKGALDCFNQGICYNPVVSLFNARAACHKQLDMYKEAYFDYSFSIRLEPEAGMHYCNRGLVLSKLRKAALALEDLDLAVRYEPSAAHYYARGTVYAEYGRNEEAVTDYSIALTKDELSSLNQDFFVKCRYRRALAYFELQRYEDVLQDCQQVLMLDAASVTARSLLGRTYKILNEHQKAEHMLSEAILLDEHTPALYTERGDIRFRTELKNKIIEGIYDFDKAVTLLEIKLSARIIESAATHLSSSAKVSKIALGGGAAAGHPTFTKMHSFNERGGGDNSSTSSATLSSRLPNPSNRPPFRFFNNLSKEDQVVSTSTLYYRDIEEQLADALYKRAQAKMVIEGGVGGGGAGGLGGGMSNAASALEDALRASALVEEDDDYHLVAASCYIHLQEYAQAQEILTHILHRHPHNAKAIYMHAFCMRATGVASGSGSGSGVKGAIEGLTKIIEMRRGVEEDGKGGGKGKSSVVAVPVHRVYEMRGTLFYEINAHKLALMDLGKAISINPSNAGNYFLRGDCHCKLGNYEQALTDYDLAGQKGFSDSIALRLSRGSVKRLLKNTQGALEDFQEAVALISDRDQLSRARILSFCAFCHIDIGNYEDALLVLNEASEINQAIIETTLEAYSRPTSPGDAKEEKPENKEDTKAQLFYLHRMSWILKYHVALSYYMLKDYSVCASYLQECISHESYMYIPDDLAKGAVYFYLGQCMQFMERHLEAKEQFEISAQTHFVNDIHNCFIVKFAIGKVLQALGDHAQALEVLDYCLTLDPKSSHALFRRAWSHKALGDYIKAGADFESAKLLRPDDPNFAIDYKRIAKCEYMIVHSDPDLVEPFHSLLPVPGMQGNFH